MENNILLEVRDLKKYFPVTKGLIFQRMVAEVKAVDGIDFHIKRGETLGLVGESGCGKTTVGRTTLLLERPTGGEVFFEGENLCQLDKKRLRRMRRKMQMIFQDPFASLDPRMSVGSIVGEPLQIHRLLRKERQPERVQELLQVVGLSSSLANRYPHELSGGQRQRVGIARALAVEPDLIICDEPVSALDVSIQAQIINLLAELQATFSLAYLFIAHDLAVVRHISDRIAVMYLGKIVEVASQRDLYENPLHPYTKALLSAVPVPDPVAESQRHRIILVGDVPSPLNPPSGCSFHTRCSVATKECSDMVPYLKEMDNSHWVRCHVL